MMTSRYSHNPVPLELPFNVRSLQTKADDLPKPLLRSHHSSYSSNSTPINSGRTSPAASDNTLTPGGQHGGWITGNSTERSSLASSCSLDDIDRNASSMVTKHFDTIQSILFNEQSRSDWSSSAHVSKGTQSDTHRECQEWGAQFHHLRVLGSQIKDVDSHTRDMGYQCIPRDSSSTSPPLHFLDVTDEHLDTGNFSESITGRGILPKHPPTEATAFTNMDDDIHNGFEFLREEVFAQDGVYEEVIAIDRSEENVEPKAMVVPSRRRVGYPPITPNACITNSVMTKLFDDLWKTVIEWMWPLILKEYPALSDDVMQQPLDVNPPPNLSNPTPVFDKLTFLTDKPILSRAVTHVGHMSESPQKSIDSILKVSKIPIVSRDSLDGSNFVATRPGSSFHTRARPVSRSISKQLSKRSQLPPLHGSDRLKEDGSSLHVHVKKLLPQNVVESLSPPPSSATYTRNNTLPPIHMERERKSYYNRASSAVHVDNKDTRNFHINNRGYGYLPSERPSTTNEMRSDNLTSSIIRRSSTPLGQNRSQFIGGNKMLNITGSGLQPSSDYSHIPPDILEDHEGSIEDGILHNNHWPSNSSNNNRYRRNHRATIFSRC